jgi:hypothetical protein
MMPGEPDLQHISTFLQLDEGPYDEGKIRRPREPSVISNIVRFFILATIAFIVIGILVKDPTTEELEVDEPLHGELVVIDIEPFPYRFNSSSSDPLEIHLRKTDRIYYHFWAAVLNTGQNPVSTKDVDLKCTVRTANGIAWANPSLHSGVLMPNQYEKAFIWADVYFLDEDSFINVTVHLRYEEEVMSTYRWSLALEEGMLVKSQTSG